MLSGKTHQESGLIILNSADLIWLIVYSERPSFWRPFEWLICDDSKSVNHHVTFTLHGEGSKIGMWILYALSKNNKNQQKSIVIFCFLIIE